MLKMVDIEFIRKKHFVEGWSIRRLSRQLEISRQAVRKAVASSAAPRYEMREPRPSPVMDPYRELILSWLAADQRAPRKQRHTAKRIYDRLVGEYQFQGAEPTVRRYVARLRDKQPEVFIPLAAVWGQQAQTDWGQALVRIAGADVTAHLFCMRLRASGAPFAWAAPTEKLEAFLEGHVRGFEWFGGVPVECVYDNPKTAVVRILAGPARVEQTQFASLRAHYLFDSLFCRPAEGHEKGAVENLVGYVRRNALVPVPDFPSWEALNAHLLSWCAQEQQRAGERWSQERAALRALPLQPFHCAVTRLVVVNRLSLVRVDHNRYSVPCRYVGRNLRVELFSDRIEVWDGVNRLAEHGRCYGRGETRLELAHYLPALARKPRAASHAAVVGQLPAIYADVRRRLMAGQPEGYREFAAILLLHREFCANAVTAALEEAWQRDCLQATAVRQILLNRLAPMTPPSIKVPLSLTQTALAPPNLAQYDTLARAVHA